MLMEIFTSVLVFTSIIMLLVLVILVARSRLMPIGHVQITVNDELTLDSPVGIKLLNALADAKIFLASACGGQGTCGQCRVRIDQGGGAILPTEKNHINRQQAAAGERLACQVVTKQSMQIEVPPGVFGVKKWLCRVRSNRNVSTFIKELILELPKGEEINFRAGSYIQVECPPHHIYYRDLQVEEVYRADWDEYDIWRYESKTDVPVVRAYSMANAPEENHIVMLNVRIATPPPSHPKAPPGIMSSYLHSLKEGDEILVSGPFGDFFAKESDAEMIFIGGGAGMAPMRSHIFHQLHALKTKRKIEFWYGARNLKELFYQQEFDQLQQQFDNFHWHVVLSQPKEGDHWQGYRGYVHDMLLEHYLKDHPDPQECEYYLCGPSMMMRSTIGMLDELGVEPENILFDDFGS